MKKICIKCNKEKNTNDFNFNKKRRREKYCKECQDKKKKSSPVPLVNLLKIYKISEEQYNFKLQKQNNECAICETDLNKLSSKNIHIDHCHKTNKFRGILCNYCNALLGQIKDDINLVERFITLM